MATEVFGRIGESELHEERSFGSFNRNKDDDFQEFSEDVEEHEATELSKIKKEYNDRLEDDSLDLDSCDKLTRD